MTQVIIKVIGPPKTHVNKYLFGNCFIGLKGSLDTFRKSINYIFTWAKKLPGGILEPCCGAFCVILKHIYILNRPWSVQYIVFFNVASAKSWVPVSKTEARSVPFAIRLC